MMLLECHRSEAERPFRRRSAWRPVFLECIRCRGAKVLCTIVLLDPEDPLRIWLCVPCERQASEDMKRAILTCETCNTDEHSTMMCPNTKHLVAVFESRNDGSR